MTKMIIDFNKEESSFLYNYKIDNNLASKEIVIKMLIQEAIKKTGRK